MKHQVATEIAKAAPAVAVAGYNSLIAAVPVVIMFLTLAYLILQIGYLVWKWHKEAKQ